MTSTNYRVYFFIPLAETLAVPEQAYELDVSAPMAGAGRISASEPHRTDHAAHTGSVSLFPRYVLVDETELLGVSDTVIHVMKQWVAWAFEDAVENDDPPETVQTWRTIIEASVIMPPGWVPHSAVDEEQEDADLEAALDDVIEATNTLQNLDYTLTKRAKTPVSPQSLPAVLLFVVGVREGGFMRPAPEGVGGIYLNHAGREAHELRRHEDDDLIPPELIDALPRTPYEKIVEEMREADALLRLSGSYRPALIMTAAACESLLDMTLMFLMWESGRTPESCASRFVYPRSCRDRVKSDFAPLLGGSWDHTKVDALRQWIDRVVEPRNQAIHFGLRVDRRAAEEAWIAFEELADWLRQRLWTNFMKFPTTASTCFSALALIPSVEEMDEILPGFMAKGRPIKDSRIFERWVGTLQALTSKQSLREPDLARGGLLAVVTPTGDLVWVWHDWLAGKACSVSTDGDTEREVKKRIKRSKKRRGEYLAFSVPSGAAVTQTGEWLEEHCLVPGLQVLPDESDLRM